MSLYFPNGYGDRVNHPQMPTFGVPVGGRRSGHVIDFSPGEQARGAGRDFAAGANGLLSLPTAGAQAPGVLPLNPNLMSPQQQFDLMPPGYQNHHPSPTFLESVRRNNALNAKQAADFAGSMANVPPPKPVAATPVAGAAPAATAAPAAPAPGPLFRTPSTPEFGVPAGPGGVGPAGSTTVGSTNNNQFLGGIVSPDGATQKVTMRADTPGTPGTPGLSSAAIDAAETQRRKGIGAMEGRGIIGPGGPGAQYNPMIPAGYGGTPGTPAVPGEAVTRTFTRYQEDPGAATARRTAYVNRKDAEADMVAGGYYTDQQQLQNQSDLTRTGFLTNLATAKSKITANEAAAAASNARAAGKPGGVSQPRDTTLDNYSRNYKAAIEGGDAEAAARWEKAYNDEVARRNSAGSPTGPAPVGPTDANPAPWNRNQAAAPAVPSSVMPGGPAAQVRVANQAEYDALPAGTAYIGPSGQLRRKP